MQAVAALSVLLLIFSTIAFCLESVPTLALTIDDTTAANVGMISQVGKYHAILFSVGRSLHGDSTFTAYASYEFALGPERR